jgi:hypothetical protein
MPGGTVNDGLMWYIVIVAVLTLALVGFLMMF